MKSLLETIKTLKSQPMHMPGHKRNTKSFPHLAELSADIDITEIDGFDNLHDACGILKESMDRCAKIRGADRAFYLVNGATCGILAAVHALVRRGDNVICARNCHKSVYNALELVGARVHFVMPEPVCELGCMGGISAESVEKAVQTVPDARLIIVTSPTYEGVISDIEGICRISHIPVLVDSAHGAHLGYGNIKSPTECGADIVVESLHKTMPSLTQTAVCYASEKYADKIAYSLSIFETSSPSYILLSSIDSCVNLVSENGTEIFEDWNRGLDSFYGSIQTLKTLKIYNGTGAFAFDRSKIVIYGAMGGRITEGLRKNGIEPEMTSLYYTVCMTGAGDTAESLSALADTLKKLDRELDLEYASVIYPELPVREYLPGEVRDMEGVYVDINGSAGKISAEYLFAYPPGIPLVIPGEVISSEIAELILKYQTSGVEILNNTGKILVVNT